MYSSIYLNTYDTIHIKFINFDTYAYIDLYMYALRWLSLVLVLSADYILNVSIVGADV